MLRFVLASAVALVSLGAAAAILPSPQHPSKVAQEADLEQTREDLVWALASPQPGCERLYLLPEEGCEREKQLQLKLREAEDELKARAARDQT